ncbi:hypothetical protein ACFL29_01460 [Patescibacteria group bacterium]
MAIKLDNITLIKRPLKRRFLRILSETDYEGANTKKLGLIFGLIDISLGPVLNAKLFDIINEAISRYYNSSLEYDIAFDDMINFLNRRASQFLPEKDKHDQRHIAIGVLKEEKLLFCASGQIYAYLTYPQDIKKIFPEKDEQPLDVSEKLFSYSLNGQILDKQILYICNSEFDVAINPYQLHKAIGDSGAKEVVSKIKDTLLQEKDDGNYNALFIYDSDTKTKEGASASLEKLFKQEQKIAEDLSPSILNNLRRNLKSGSILTHILTFIIFGIKKLASLLKQIIIFIAFLLFNLFFILTNLRGKRKEKQLAVKSRIKGILFQILDFYKSLTAISKAMLIGIIIVVLLLIFTVSYSLHVQEINTLKASHQEKLQTAENLYNQADADLLFQEKNISVKKLKEALNVLESVPEKIHDKEYIALLNKVKNKLYKIQNISEITSPVLLADFAPEEGEITQVFSPVYLYKENVGVPAKNQIISINKTSPAVVKNNFTLRGLESGIYYYSNERSTLYTFESENILQATSVSGLTSEIKEIVLHSNEKIAYLATYNDKLYTISNTAQAISVWKHNPSLIGFGKPSLWATDSLPNGTSISSFAIDGYLYILLSNNQIFKYYRGNKIDWSYDTSGLDEEISFFKILTDDSLNYIYLLDKKRVSIMTKDGDFMAHLLLPTLEGIESMAVDEASETIYVLAGQKIYAFSYKI